jgi:hypothetical protein
MNIKPRKLINLIDYSMDRDLVFVSEWAVAKPNAIILLEKVNALLNELNFEGEISVSSGFRPKEINEKTIGASKNSLHIIGKAIDIQSEDNKFYYFFDPIFNKNHSDLYENMIYLWSIQIIKKFIIHRIHMLNIRQ